MAGNCLRTANNELVTSEWEEIQYKHGNKVGKYATHEEELKQQREMKKFVENFVAEYDPLENRTVEELDKMLEEDGLGDEDEDAIVRYREQRRREMLERQRGQRHGSVRHIAKNEYVSQVNGAGEGVWVVLMLVEEGQPDCDALRRACTEAAERLPRIKFLTIKSTDAIENFPRERLPMVLLYRDGEMQRQVDGMAPWGGKRPSSEDIESALRRLGPLRGERKVDSDDEEEEEEEKERAPIGVPRRGGNKFSIM